MMTLKTKLWDDGSWGGEVHPRCYKLTRGCMMNRGLLPAPGTHGARTAGGGGGDRAEMLTPFGVQQSGWQHGTALPMAGTSTAAKQTPTTTE